MKRTAPLSILAALALVGAPALADNPIKGAVVLTRVAPTAVLTWDASSVVTDLAATHTPDADVWKTLESDGAVILGRRAATLSAETLELRVIYAKSAMGAQYGDPSLDQQQVLVTLRATRKNTIAKSAGWSKAISSGAKIPDLTIEVSGKLPSA